MNSAKGNILVIIMLLALFAVASLTNVQSVNAVPVPNGIVYYIQLTITNSQTVATPSPFQQMIVVNSSAYSSYEAPNLQNIEFFDSNGNTIPSWLESGASSSSTSSIYWLKLANGIPAESSVTVYMGFGSPDANFLNTQTTGEAPELSPRYGQYDDGAKVFGFYENFMGTSLNSNIWNQVGTGGSQGDTSSITVDNGLTLSSTPNGVHPDDNWIGSTVPAAQFTHPLVLDVLAAASSSFYNGRIMFEDTYPSNMGQGNGFAIEGPSTTNSWLLGTCSAGACNSVNIQNSSETTINGQPNTGYKVFSLAANSSLVTGFVNYEQVASDSIDVPSYSPSIGIQLENNYGTASMLVTWIRIRALPPNDVMPAVSGISTGTISSQSPGTTNTQSGSPSVTLYPAQVNGFSVSINGVARPSSSLAQITSILWQWGDGQATNGFFPQSHTYSQAGTYNVIVTVTDSNGQTASATESVSVSAPQQTSTSNAVWAFNGAYAVYQISVSFSGTVIGGLQTSGSFTSTVNYTLFDFNAQNQNFDVSTQYSGYLTPLSTNNIQASLSGPSPFPVVTTSDLNTLNNGKIPSDLPATSVSDNVMVKVPAGTFNTDQVTFDNGAMLWFDAKSGLLVQASGTFLGYPGYGNGISEELVKTNIPTSGSTSSLWIYIASAAAIVVIILIASIFAIRRRSKVSKQPAGIASQPVNERIELKLERLKKLVEEGLISQQEYEMKKKELLGEQ